MSKISAFTIITNPRRNQFPYLEAIYSVLKYADKVVVVDGGSTDGSLLELEMLGDRVEVINIADTKWEDDWTYCRMGHNLGIGFEQCLNLGSDFIIKFDSDYIFEEGYDLKKDLLKAEKEKSYTLDFCRHNFMITDRYFLKSNKTLIVNAKLCRKEKVDVRWGYDLKNFGLCDEAIIFKERDDNLVKGELLKRKSKSTITTGLKVSNYGYCFRDQEVGSDLMHRNMRAFYRQQHKPIPTKESIWKSYNSACLSAFKKSKQYPINLEDHPEIIRDKIKNLTSDKQGYNYWGLYEQSKYYD